jgi:hypothetical protein
VFRLPARCSSAVFGEALADTTPLYGLITRYINEQALEQIVAEYNKGRLLLIGTASLDAQRPVIWNRAVSSRSWRGQAISGLWRYRQHLQRIGGGRRTHRMRAEAIDLRADAGFTRIFADDVVIDRRPSSVPVPVELARAVVGHRTEHGAAGIGGVTSERQICLDEALRHGMHGNEADFARP